MNGAEVGSFPGPKPGSFFAALACLLCAAPAASQISPKGAEPATLAAQKRVASELPLQDRTDFEDAMYGFVGTIPDAETKIDAKHTAWSMKPYEFIRGPAPATVNPSLWRQAQLNEIHGLFEVTDRIYQVRGLDASNMTIVEGNTSLILIDTLFTVETARSALDLYFKYRPRKPIGTVIFTHSHADHFGGTKGVVSEEDVTAGKVQLLAPAGFLEAIIAENVMAGTAMNRRSVFQFGGSLIPGPRGLMDEGTAKAPPRGTTTLLPPTRIIGNNIERRNIDGIEIIFQLAPGAEAPSEMHMYFPQFHVLDMAEDVVHAMHNLCAIRGTQVRDANQKVTVVSVDPATGTVVLLREGTATGAYERDRGQTKLTRDGKEDTFDITPGVAHWRGYATFVKGIVFADSLLVTRDLTLKDQSGKSVHAAERTIMLLNEAPYPTL